MQPFSAPPRFNPTSAKTFLQVSLCLALLCLSVPGSGLETLTMEKLVTIPGRTVSVFDQMFPPNLERIRAVSLALGQTFAMAWIGTLIGLPFALASGVLAAANTSPHPLVSLIARGMVTFLRTTPAIIWGIVLIAAVGLGPRSGTLSIAIATVGFCGRFFAEAIEEVNENPVDAIRSLGGTRAGILFGVILPAVMPSFVNTTLFNLEHSVRSSAVLGIVGAGGIGIELMVSLKTFHYDEAATIMALVFIMVMLVEQVCAKLRHNYL